MAASLAAAHLLEKHTDEIVGIKIMMGKLEQRQENTDADVAEIKTIIKEHTQRMEA